MHKFERAFDVLTSVKSEVNIKYQMPSNMTNVNRYVRSHMASIDQCQSVVQDSCVLLDACSAS